MKKKTILLILSICYSWYLPAQIFHYKWVGLHWTDTPPPITKTEYLCEIMTAKQKILKKVCGPQATHLTKKQIERVRWLFESGYADSISGEYYNFFKYKKDTIIANEKGVLYFTWQQDEERSVDDPQPIITEKIFVSKNLMIYWDEDERHYGFQIHTQTEDQPLFSMPKKKILKSIPPVFENNSNFANNANSIEAFEKHILQGSKPPNSNVETKYENGYRAIVWDVPLIKTYEYSNEVFDKLGYDLVQSDYKNKKAYRNCAKGVLVEVGECNFKQGLCITMQWTSKDFRKSNKYFMFCK